MTNGWRNRIVGQGEKPASEFLANPYNWRIHPRHQAEALRGVLSEVGWVQNVVENARTGNLIDGHLRIMEALRLGDDTPVPYVQVDLSEEEERLVLATLDPLVGLAVADKEKLEELLREVEAQAPAIQEMLAGLSNESPQSYVLPPVTDILGDIGRGMRNYILFYFEPEDNRFTVLDEYFRGSAKNAHDTNKFIELWGQVHGDGEI